MHQMQNTENNNNKKRKRRASRKKSGQEMKQINNGSTNVCIIMHHHLEDSCFSIFKQKSNGRTQTSRRTHTVINAMMKPTIHLVTHYFDKNYVLQNNRINI